MGKISSKLSGLLVAIAIAPVTALPIQAAIRQYPSPIVTEVTDNYLAVSFSEIWKRLRRKQVPAGSRGDETEWFTCAIVPGKLIDSDTGEETTIKVWNPRPLFLWRGTWASTLYCEYPKVRRESWLQDARIVEVTRSLSHTCGRVIRPNHK